MIRTALGLGLTVGLLPLAALRAPFNQPQTAGCPTTTCEVVVSRSYAYADPIVTVRGRWTRPDRRPAAGTVRNAVRLVSHGSERGLQSLEFGVADSFEKDGPTIYSVCSGCYTDEAHPRPDPGWKEIGIHGAPTYPVDYIVNYDSANDAWAWYINGSAVRYEAHTGLRGPSTLDIGSIIDGEGAGLPSSWHSQVLVVQASRQAGVFAPGDWYSVEWIWFERFLIQYFPDGTVYTAEVVP